ncbi:MAG: hypothetical protein QN163_01400 [Armatimonadota bacterium]|nr:hypothetical protein [Armatimonadota bacterium]MDR5698172.1 hypothetical protein [Armatimonadota bacterium]
MADEVRRVDYYYVTVPDRPGEGARVLSALREGGVNLLAYLAFPVEGGNAQLDLVPEDAVALRSVADRSGWQLTGPKRAFLIRGDDRVGAAAEYAKKLGDAGINIVAAAATSAGGGRYGMILWVRPQDYEEAARAIGA